MAEKRVRSKFHYGFYAAMKVFYDLANAPVSYEQEKELGEEPVRLDFLIIKKHNDAVLDDPIGTFFRRVNLCEYKSPDDGLSIDDFYKAQGYGLIYKSFDRKVNELPVKDMTITLVRHAYPREMIKALRASGFIVTQPHAGIYRFEGEISIPTQLIVSSQLPAGEYYGLKLIAKGCTKSDIIKYAEKSISAGDSNIIANARAVISVCLSVNRKLGEELREDKRMDDVIHEIFKEAFDEAEKRGIKQGLEQGVNQGANQVQERVARDMLKKNFPLSLIEEISKLSGDTIRRLADSLGVAVIL